MTVMDRLANKYEPEPNSGCWIWTAGIAGNGYAYVWHQGAMRRAHLVIYRLLVGPVPVGKELDHVCRTRACVNPSHLRAVTHQQNIQASPIMGRANLAKTHCPAGHAYDAENTMVYGRHRQCRECGRRRARERMRRIAAAKRIAR